MYKTESSPKPVHRSRNSSKSKKTKFSFENPKRNTIKLPDSDSEDDSPRRNTDNFLRKNRGGSFAFLFQKSDPSLSNSPSLSTSPPATSSVGAEDDSESQELDLMTFLRQPPKFSSIQTTTSESKLKGREFFSREAITCNSKMIPLPQVNYHGSLQESMGGTVSKFTLSPLHLLHHSPPFAPSLFPPSPFRPFASSPLRSLGRMQTNS